MYEYIVILVFILVLAIAIYIAYNSKISSYIGAYGNLLNMHSMITGAGGNLEPVSKQNITELRKIQVNINQQGYVATIDDSLIQASFLKNWHGFAFKDGEKIIGFASYADYDKIPGSVKIYKIIIDKDYQGMGYGRKLLEQIIQKILEHNANIYIDVHTDNIVALQLYKKMFEVVSNDDKNTVLKYKSE